MNSEFKKKKKSDVGPVSEPSPSPAEAPALPRVYFVGAGPGDPELITLRAMKLLQKADFVLYTGSLIPAEVLQHAGRSAEILSSQDMSYNEIFAYLKDRAYRGTLVRLHTGDPSLYSTIAKQIEFLRSNRIAYEIVPGVSAAFAGAASQGLEFTVPGVSQTLVLTRMEGRTPNPETMENLFRLKHSSLVFYLSATLLDAMIGEANKAGWSMETPCRVIEKASWPEERVLNGTLGNIAGMTKEAGVRGAALIFLGDFLKQEEKAESHLYSGSFTKQERYEPAASKNRKITGQTKETV